MAPFWSGTKTTNGWPNAEPAGPCCSSPGDDLQGEWAELSQLGHVPQQNRTIP